MALDSKLKPEDNLWFYFKEGLLNVLGEKEAEVHYRNSRIYYGKRIESVFTKENFPYILPLVDLKKIEKYRFLWEYLKINEFTQVRKTLTGGLQIKRINPISRDFSYVATFSRKEFNIIRKYL